MLLKLGGAKLSKTTKSNYFLYFLIIVISLSLFYASNYSSFHDQYAISDDVRQSIYWMYGFQDSNLFKDDPLTDYAYFFHSQGVGVVAIYYILIRLLGNPLLVFKLLSLLFVPLSSIFIFKIGKKLKNRMTGILLTVLFLIFLSSMSVTNGFYKNFGVVLFIIFFYFYISKKYVSCFISTVLMSLFYAPITLICLTLLAFSMIDPKNKPFYLISNKKRIYLFLVTIVLCLVILSSTTLLRDKSQFGSLITYKEMKQMPEFYNGGRAPILPISLISAFIYPSVPFILPEVFLFGWPFLLNPQSYWLFYIYALSRIVILTGFLILLIKTLKTKIFSHRKEIWFLLISGITLFFISKCLLFYAYVPKRYISYTFPLFLIIFTALVLDKFLETIKEQHKRKLYFGAFLLFLLIFYLPITISQLNRSMDNTECKENIQLYEYLSSLPKDITLAGHPYDMDCVPIFSKRKVYLNYELSHPFYSKYYSMIKNRTHKLFYAYYASNHYQLKSFCKKEKVDYFIFNKIRFGDSYLSAKEFYINPFNNYVIKLIENKSEFYFNKIQKEDITFEDNTFIVIECQ